MLKKRFGPRCYFACKSKHFLLGMLTGRGVSPSVAKSDGGTFAR